MRKTLKQLDISLTLRKSLIYMGEVHIDGKKERKKIPYKKGL